MKLQDKFPTCTRCNQKSHRVYQSGKCYTCLTQEFRSIQKRLDNSKILGYFDSAKDRIAVTPANLDKVYALLSS